MARWDIVLKKAVLPDGSLFFPERLTEEFLSDARRIMGSYIWSCQYMNEPIPAGEQTFKKEWVRYYSPYQIPERVNHFAFIDPAIGETKSHDYTGLVVVAVDEERRWFVKHATRQRINPTEIIELAFRTHKQFQCATIGIEDVAFQRSIIHFAMEESRKRGTPLPVTGVKRGPDKTKQMRILQLVPRFEWGSLLLNAGLHDLELELAQFPRGAHDDLLDALASIEDIVYYPAPLRRKDETLPANHPGYEAQYRQRLLRGTRGEKADY